MILTASHRRSCRSATPGQPSPTTCSLRRSPEPRPKGEAVIGELPKRRGRLRNDDGVIAHARTRHRGHESKPLGGVGDGAEYGSGKGCMSLLFDPREEVIGDRSEIEAHLLARPLAPAPWAV